MARIRQVKPCFFRDEDLIDAEIRHGLPHLMLVYEGLWTVADKRGCFAWSPRTLQLDVLPHRPHDGFLKCLDALVAEGFVVRYEVGGRQYAKIPTLGKHQKFHPKEAVNEEVPDMPVEGSAEPGKGSAGPGNFPASKPDSGIGYGNGNGGGSKAPPVSPSAPIQTDPVVNLAARTGDHPDDCAKAIRELLADGVPQDRIDRRIEAMTEPIGVWVWKRTVLTGWKAEQPKPGDHGPKSPSSNGAVAARLAADKERAAADLAAFQASGFATRSEWIASKRAGVAT